MRPLIISALLTSVNALWPIPRHLTNGTSPLVIDTDAFSIDISEIQSVPDDLRDAVSRTQYQLFNDSLGRLVVGRGASDQSLLETAPSLKTLKLSLATANNSTDEADAEGTTDCKINIEFGLGINNEGEGDTQISKRAQEAQEICLAQQAQDNQSGVKSIAEETALPVEERDEGYILRIPNDGSEATLVANTTLGLLRGLTTFGQIWYQYEDSLYSIEAPFEIIDAPYYMLVHSPDNPQSRGVVSYWILQGIFDDIKRTVDAMSWTKLNMLHWHIVDSQSFPVVFPELPELAQKGAYSSWQQYSTSDLDDIVAYAAARGVDVMLEIDTPGHTAVIHNAYPEYIACFESSPWASYANEPPSGQLRLTEPDVIDFTKKLFKAAIKHTPGKYFSTGGDEINQRCYNEDPVVQASLTSSGKTFQQALTTFTNETHETLVENGKTPVVWEEMVLDQGNLELSLDTVVLIWISSSDAKSVAEAGFRIVHAPSDYFYLDCGHGAWVGDFPNGNSWCDPFKTWQKAYTFDPMANLTESEATLVLGGQSLLWAEQSDPSNLDSILWPRAAAAAEVFWTGPTHPDGQPLSGKEALPRLHDLRYRYVHRGVRAIALQPEYCALRPHACDLTA